MVSLSSPTPQIQHRTKRKERKKTMWKRENHNKWILVHRALIRQITNWREFLIRSFNTYVAVESYRHRIVQHTFHTVVCMFVDRFSKLFAATNCLSSNWKNTQNKIHGLSKLVFVADFFSNAFLPLSIDVNSQNFLLTHPVISCVKNVKIASDM